jgi:uncharacterized protein YndB with AHSA1/START domain
VSEANRRISVEVERRIAAPPDRVFDAWLDPQALGRWLFATPDGRMERVEVDPRVGGRFLIAERRDGELAEHFGEYLEIDRPRRLVFTFAADREEAPSLVTVTIEADGDGSRIRLVHEMDAQWADYEARTREGWASILEALERSLGS